MNDRRPSNVANERIAPWWGRRAVSYCEELRAHRTEFEETRQRVVIAWIVVTVIGIALLATGRTAMAAFLGLTPMILLTIILGGNEWILRRTIRRIATDCPEVPEPRDL